MKAAGRLSLADAYAVVLAHHRDATLVVVADDDFDKLPVEIELERFRDHGVWGSASLVSWTTSSRCSGPLGDTTLGIGVSVVRRLLWSTRRRSRISVISIGSVSVNHGDDTRQHRSELDQDLHFFSIGIE